MATSDDKLKQMLSLTDCLYFTNGHCMFSNKCRYRHCRAAVKQLEKCPKWPSTCRNVDCSYRHTGTPSKTTKSVPQEKALINFFWDIENVPIPKGQKPFDIVQRIRQKLVIEPGLQEADFSCYCNCTTISQENQQSLSHAAVRIIHIPDRKSNAVDRQIMLDLDRFERTHHPPATIVLISGDIDFVGKLSDLRHQARFHVIVIHNKPAKQELKATVNEHYPWEFFTESSQQQEQLPQPIIRDNSARLTTQPANFRPIFNDRVNNDNDINGTASSKPKEPPLRSLLDLLVENNLPQSNYIQPPFPTSRRRAGSVTRNHRSKNDSQPQKPPTPQFTHRTAALNIGGDTPPSISSSIVPPRARICRTTSTNQLNQQNIAMPDSCEQKQSTIDDDTTKIPSNTFSCPYCTNKFSTIQALRQHQKNKNHLYNCPVCKEGFPTSTGLKQHQSAKGHNVTDDIDDQCNVQLDATDNSITHQPAIYVGHNLNMPSNRERPPISQKPMGGHSFIGGNINNVNNVINNKN